jgi:periplasmic protein CpxP/Spy
MKRTLLACLAVLTLALAPALPAQRAGQRPLQRAAAPRDTLLVQVQRRMAQMVRQRLRLTDVQVRRLQQTNRRYDEQRRLLLEQERRTRRGLRDLVTADSADQNRVSALLDTMLLIQRQRLDLVQQEQRDLAQFLSPLQRAKYFALQEQIRKRLEDFRRSREARLGPPPRAGWAPPPHR